MGQREEGRDRSLKVENEFVCLVRLDSVGGPVRLDGRVESPAALGILCRMSLLPMPQLSVSLSASLVAPARTKLRKLASLISLMSMSRAVSGLYWRSRWSYKA